MLILMKNIKNIKNSIFTIILSAIILLLLDSIYLSSVSNHYNNLLLKIQGSKITIKLISVMLCYILLVGGLNYFILLNNTLNNTQKLINAFILGVVIYGIYETTNYAIFNDWSIFALITDSLWGGILFLLTTLIINFINTTL